MNMERRGEIRFQASSRGKIIDPNTPASEVDCLLLDISATGMKLVADKSLPVDGELCVEFEDGLVLVKVRHCALRGSKFSIGVFKLHTLSRLALPQDATRIEKIRTLIHDFQERLLRDPLDGVESGAPVSRPVERLDLPLARMLPIVPKLVVSPPLRPTPAPTHFSETGVRLPEPRDLALVPLLESLRPTLSGPEPDAEAIRTAFQNANVRAKADRLARSRRISAGITAGLLILAMAVLFVVGALLRSGRVPPSEGPAGVSRSKEALPRPLGRDPAQTPRPAR